MKADIGIELEHLKGSSDLLKTLLGDEMVLYVKTLNYHWNVRGSHFGPLHKLFKKNYEGLAEYSDSVAERIRTLGVDAPGSMEEFLKLSRIDEHKGSGISEKEMLLNLLEDHETVIKNLRIDIDLSIDKFKDVGTSDFLTELLRNHEQIAWILRSHVESFSKHD